MGPTRRSYYPCGHEVAFLGHALASKLGILSQSRQIEEVDALYASSHGSLSILGLCLVVETPDVGHHPCSSPFQARGCVRDVWAAEFERTHRLSPLKALEESEAQAEQQRPECWSRIRSEHAVVAVEVGCSQTFRLPYTGQPLPTEPLFTRRTQPYCSSSMRRRS